VQLTGPLANTGCFNRDAYRFTMDRINPAGGFKI
jgi:hypothetical protein